MIYLNGFIFCGFVCMVAQIIYDHSKLTPGHITTLFVVVGALLESMNIYDFILKNVAWEQVFQFYLLDII